MFVPAMRIKSMKMSNANNFLNESNLQIMNISIREKEVLQLIIQEFTAKEIASALYISTHTVDSHRRSLLHKLQVKNSAGMVRAAFEMGLFSISG